MYESLRSQIMKGLIDWVDFHFGEELTGYAVYISWDGTILDIDKEEIALLQRVQGKPSKGIITRVRMMVHV